MAGSQALMTGSQPALLLDKIGKSFGGFRAVDDLSFCVERGEIFGFLGPNGAGKTTTLRMILDIIPPTTGRMMVLGSENALPVRHRIGYLPEERGLYRKMRAFETIAYFAALRGVPGREAKRRAMALLEEFGLGDFAKNRNESLSKGMAQKVQLLATIAHDPELLILDEPFSGLDPINQATLEELIRRLQNEGRTIIFSTHVMEHAERLCDRFLILARSKKRFEGTLAEARDAFPPQVIIRLPNKAGLAERLENMTGVIGVAVAETAVDETVYRVELERGHDPQAFLRAAFEAGLEFTRFDVANASLHEIFVALAADPPEGGAKDKAPSRAEEKAA